MSIKKITLILCVFLLTFQSKAGKIERAFESLKIYNYFDAKQKFEKSLKKSPSPASFGLAIIYFRTDNPFHNIDSAYNMILRAEKTYELLKSKTRIKYQQYNFDYPQIISLRQQISTEFYHLAVATNKESTFQSFIDRHPWAVEQNQAIHKRDSLAYEAAREINSSAVYAAFLKKYPISEYQRIATDDYNLRIYREATTHGTVTELDQFISKNPSNPYAGDAEDRMYDLLTEKNTLENYEAFLRRFPNNRNIESAWRKLYQLYMYDYSENRIGQFLKDYPDYPFKNEVEMDRELAQQNLIPFSEGNLFGWMNYQGKIIFPATYESLGFFREGLSLAAKNGKYGYVDKANRVVIPFKYDSGFDFEDGRAIVEINEKYGIIDRTGNLLFEVEFSDIGQFSEGLIYGAKDSLYAYYDKFGMQRIEAQFDEAFSFSKGMAQVELRGKKAYIDPYGSYIVKPLYEEVAFFTDSLLVFKQNDFYGIVHRNGKVILPPTMDQIGRLANRKAIVVSNDKIGYINDSAKIIIQPTYEDYPNFMESGQFSGNYAKVKFKGKYGVIDQKGKWIIPATYNNLGEISTMISFTKGKKWGYIDLSNKLIVKPTYDFAESIINGLAIVEINGFEGLINAKGEFIIPTQFTEIKTLEDKYYLVQDQKLGLYSNKGIKLVPLEYDQIRIIDGDFLLLSRQNQVDYFYVPEQKLIVSPTKKL